MDLNDLQLDADGKVTLDGIYNEATPVPYFSTLRRLGYAIPQNAKPVFTRVFSAYRKLHRKRRLRLVDLGSSYGVNAAILKHELSMQDLFDRYDRKQLEKETRASLMACDKRFYAARGADSSLTITGVDRAEHALDYATSAGLLDAAICADLEEKDLQPSDVEKLSDTDVIISTGCIGYVGEQTFSRLLAGLGPQRPWMAHFVLRMFDYRPIASLLAKFGYVTEQLSGRTFPQRRFASPEERSEVLGRLAEQGIETRGMEGEGWFHAGFFLSRPAADASALSLPDILSVR